MKYQIAVSFASPTSSTGFVIVDYVGEDDWTNLNYWDDLSEYMSQTICAGETMLSKSFPDGHDYSLLKVEIKNIGDAEE